MGQEDGALTNTLNDLDKTKGQFLTTVENRVHSLIANGTSRRDCVAIIEIRKNGTRTRIGMSDPKDYSRRFVVLLKAGKQSGLPEYKGAKLDSYLTEPILDRVTQVWTEHYQANSALIADGMVAKLQDDPRILKELMTQIAAALRSTGSPLTEHMYRAVYHILTQEVSSHVSQHSMAEVSQHVATTLSSSAGQHVVASVSASLVTALAHVLGKLLLKHIGTAAFKTAVVGFVKKMIIKSVVTGVFTSIAASAGVATTGSLLLWIVVPVIAAFAAYEIHEFPRKLAGKVAPQVRAGVGGEFRASNESALQAIFQQAVVGNLTQIAGIVAADSDFVQTVEEAAKEWVEVH